MWYSWGKESWLLFLAFDIMSGKQCLGTGRRNHRIPEWVTLERTLVGPLAQPPCLSRPIPEHMAQDCVQIDPECLQWGRFHNLSRQSVPVLIHPDSKDVLPRIQVELLCVCFCPLPLVLLNRGWKSTLAVFKFVIWLILESRGSSRWRQRFSCSLGCWAQMKNDFSPEFCYASLNDLILCEDDLCCCLYQSTLEENEVFFLTFSIVGVYDYVATLLLTSALVPSLSLLLLFKQKCVGTDSTHPPAQTALGKVGFLCAENTFPSALWLLYLVVVRKYHIKYFPQTAGYNPGPVYSQTSW